VTNAKIKDVSWTKLTDIPAGFADGVDDIGGSGVLASSNTITNTTTSPALTILQTGATNAILIKSDNAPAIQVTAGGLLFSGNVGDIPVEGAGARLMWYPAKRAFRAGGVNGTKWDDTNIGDYSTAIGYNTTAKGEASTAMGYETNANKNYSTAMGYNTTANGDYSTAMGGDTTASGNYSTAMGRYTTASSIYSTAMGYYTTASGNYSTAMGYNTAASGISSTAMGGDTTASGNYSTAMGMYVTAGDADYTIAIGRGVDDENLLINNTANSFMVGFNRTSPTLTVSSYSVTINAAGGSSADVLVISTGTTNLFRFQSNGEARSLKTFTSGGADYAEWFEKEDDCQPGDIVGLNLTTGKARKYVTGDIIIGICSSNPGFVGNRPIDKSDEEIKEKYVLVGLTGQLSVNKDQVDIIGRKVLTKDGKQVGFLLEDGKVFLRVKE
jgi:hypothetical protein